MKLYGTPPTRALRVLWLLRELDLPYTMEDVEISPDTPRDPAFMALNPAGKVPAVQDGDLVMTESAAIPLWLAERDPERRFIPEDVDERGQMYRWIFFLVTEIEQPLWRGALHNAVYPEERRIPAERANARRDCAAMLAVFEKHMEGREWVVGDRASVADFIAAYTLDWARAAELLQDFPVLTAFVERMYARPRAPMTIAQGFAAMEREKAAADPSQ